MFHKILVAHDGSEGAQKALSVAIDLARRYGAVLHLISVIEELPKYAATIDEVEEVKAEAIRHYQVIQEEACRQAEERGVIAYDTIIPGHEVQTIVQHAEQGHFDLLVVGRYGHSARWLKHLNQPTEDWYTDRVTLSGAKGLDGQILRCAQHDRQDGRARRSVPMSCGSI